MLICFSFGLFCHQYSDTTRCLPSYLTNSKRPYHTDRSPFLPTFMLPRATFSLSSCSQLHHFFYCYLLYIITVYTLNLNLHALHPMYLNSAAEEGCNVLKSETNDKRGLIMVIMIITPISRKWKAVGNVYGSVRCSCKLLLEVFVILSIIWPHNVLC